MFKINFHSLNLASIIELVECSISNIKCGLVGDRFDFQLLYMGTVFDLVEYSIFGSNIKSGKNIMYTFTIMVQIANVYIIFLPDFMYIEYSKEGLFFTA